jgi:hypothetical protein
MLYLHNGNCEAFNYGNPGALSRVVFNVMHNYQYYWHFPRSRPFHIISSDIIVPLGPMDARLIRPSSVQLLLEIDVSRITL